LNNKILYGEKKKSGQVRLGLKTSENEIGQFEQGIATLGYMQ
jgi:hypothetical protein